MKIGHIAVVVPDPEAAAEFYTNVMGFERLGLRTAGSFPGRAVDLTDGRIHFTLVLPGEGKERRPWSHGTYGANHIGIRYDEFAKVRENLRTRGYELFGEKYAGDRTDENMTFFKFRDPVGMEVDVMRESMDNDPMAVDANN